MLKTVKIILLVVIVLTLLFQLVHSIEHIGQVVVWSLGYQDQIYMSPIGMWAMDQSGELVAPNTNKVRRAKLGFEFLHFIGNVIFLLGIVSLLYFVRTKLIIWALIIESFHVIEHIYLFFSTLFTNEAIGVSTLFGMDMSRWASISLRVWWHFVFNLIPTILVAIALIYIYRAYKKRVLEASKI